jgi:hypothetical protein
MPNEMHRPLNDLSYILECLANDHTGEARTALSSLCRSIRGRDSEFVHPAVQSTLPTLEEALLLYRERHSHETALNLSNVFREWWRIQGIQVTQRQPLNIETTMASRALVLSIAIAAGLLGLLVTVHEFVYYMSHTNRPGTSLAMSTLGLAVMLLAVATYKRTQI